MRASTRLQRNQPFDDTRPFTRANARAAGLPVSNLLTRRYRRLFHDVHVRVGVRSDVRVHAATAIGLNATGTQRWRGWRRRLRLVIVLAGLPQPEVDHRLRDDFGTSLMRFDLSIPLTSC